MELITSRSNPKVKFVRALRQRKARQESGAFLVEGIRHVGEAVQAAQAAHPDFQPQIEQIFYAPQQLTSDFAHELVLSEERRGVPCYPVTPDVFESVADKDNPQGILAVVSQPPVALSSLDPGRFPWGVALVQPQDPGNLGAILRTIDAVGASGLILLDSSVDPYHPSAVRASMGTIFWYPLVSASFAEFASWSARHGYHVFGTSARGSTGYREMPAYPSPRILLMGSERAGLSAEQAAVCEALIRLPMLGRASSLNLSVATGVFLYAMLPPTDPN